MKRRIKILVADDELNICKLIKNLIDWDTIGLDLIGFASSGNECYDMVMLHKPEIVITDIRMPGKSGIDIIKESRQQGLNTQFLIISGHAEFEYARQAIKYGVEDFLLKPINGDELTETLERIYRDLVAADEEKQAATETLENSRTVLRNSLPLSLYRREFIVGNRSMEYLNSDYCFDFKQGLFMPVVVKLYTPDVQTNHIKSMLNQIKAVVEKELGSINEDFCVCKKGLSLLCVFNFSEYKINDFYVALQYVFDSLINMINPYNYQAVMGIGAAVQMPEMLQESFLKAICACNSRLTYGGNCIINGANMDTYLLNSSLISVEEPNRRLKSIIEILDTENLSVTILEEFHRQMPDTERYPYSLNTYIRKFTTALLRDITGTHKIRDERISTIVSSLEQSVLTEVLECDSVDDVEKLMIERFTKLFEQLQVSSPDRKTITTIKDYIKDNFNKQIGLDDVAKKVFLSPQYLGILFKRETGQNFSEYLISVRIEKAKEMLRDIRYNISEISENVGYKDTPYFSKLFKKIVGVKPTQYRQMYGRGGK